MPFTIVLFAWRKTGTSPAEFKKHYENDHVELIRSLTGTKFPLSHTRYYIQRVPGENAASDNSNAAHPAVVMAGQQSDFDYDSYAELVFEDQTAFQEFYALVTAPGAKEKIAEDEEKFLDRSKLLFASIDQTSVTKRPA